LRRAIVAPDIVAEQNVLVTLVEPAVREYRMGPSRPPAAIRLLKAALFVVALGDRFH
jgi:hypothetical protein